jgi:hypothetical protein
MKFAGMLTLAITVVAATVGCSADRDLHPWPGDGAVEPVDGPQALGGNLSGLIYEESDKGGSPGVLWAVRNGPGSLFRLVWNGTIWVPDHQSHWQVGKTLLYPGGAGSPDAEGITFGEMGSRDGIYVAAEQDNNDRARLRNSILRYDVHADGMALIATDEWDLTADFTALPNQGVEGIAWIPDSYLVAAGFRDESRNRAYNPGDYPGHGSGLFLVGVETNGLIAGYALRRGGSFNRIATIAGALPGVMELHFDRETHDLWAICDVRCHGQAVVLRIDSHGRFAVANRFDRPRSLPDVDNEGFAVAPLSECSGGHRPVFWADDSAVAGHAIRRGGIPCEPALSGADGTD